VPPLKRQKAAALIAMNDNQIDDIQILFRGATYNENFIWERNSIESVKLKSRPDI
jgi:hypothetical protein